MWDCLVQEYIIEENSFNEQRNKNKDLGTYSSICNILDHLRLDAVCYVDEVDKLTNKYLSNFKVKTELKIGACIYYLISSSGLACQLKKIRVSVLKYQR